MTCFSFLFSILALSLLHTHTRTHAHFHTHLHSILSFLCVSPGPTSSSSSFLLYCNLTYLLAYQTNHIKRRNCNDKCVFLNTYTSAAHDLNITNWNDLFMQLPFIALHEFFEARVKDTKMGTKWCERDR